tara:strand:+ start:13770 stop:16757 length:2988 start_codon:yes stop_codon:yes gene_type:complete
MGNIAPASFLKTLPLPLVKSVEIKTDPLNPVVTKMDILLSLQIAKIEKSHPCGLFVALITKASTLKLLKENEEALRYEMLHKNTPASRSSLIKKYMGIEDFVKDEKIDHIINRREGVGVVSKEIPINIDIILKDNQNLWLYCITYHTKNRKDIQRKGAPQTSKFRLGQPVIEPIMINGHAPATTYLYMLDESSEDYGELNDIWVGPVHRYRKEYMAGQHHTDGPHPTLRRTKVSNQKIKDLRLLNQIDNLDLDNFVVNMRDINKHNFKNYERIKKHLGRRYFSRLYYSREPTGDYKAYFSMDWDRFINHNSSLAGLFTNKNSLRDCFGVNEITVWRQRKRRVKEGSKLANQVVPDDEDSSKNLPVSVGSLSKGTVTTMDLGNDFLNILINDPLMGKEEVNSFEYTVNFEFVDKTTLAVKETADRLRRCFAEYQSFMAKFEALGKKNFNVEEYLRVNAKVIKSDDSWLKLINEFLASIWFIFGREGFGTQSPILWKKNLTTMVNPMSATDQTFNEFNEIIKDYIGDLTRLVTKASVGGSERKFNARSKIKQGNNLIKKIKYTHTPRTVRKSTQNEVGFDYLGTGNYVEQRPIGLPVIPFEDYNRRLDIELGKYQIANPNAGTVNKYGFLSPYTIHTPYEVQPTSDPNLELADGLVILDNRLDPSTAVFLSDGSPKETNIKVTKMESILGRAGASVTSLATDLSSFVRDHSNFSVEDETEISTEQLGTGFLDDDQYLTDAISGSSEITYSHLQGQKKRLQALESSIAEKLVDGVAQDFVPPEIRRTRRVRGSLAYTKIQENKDAFLVLNSFERDINYNSLVRIQVLDGFKGDNIRLPRWRTLTQTRFNELLDENTPALCRLSSCPSITTPGNQYRLSRYNFLFALGNDFEPQGAILKTSYKKRYLYYYKRLVRLDKSWTTNINRGAANYGAEYYIANAMVFTHRPRLLFKKRISLGANTKAARARFRRLRSSGGRPVSQFRRPGRAPTRRRRGGRRY